MISLEQLLVQALGFFGGVKDEPSRTVESIVLPALAMASSALALSSLLRLGSSFLMTDDARDASSTRLLAISLHVLT